MFVQPSISQASDVNRCERRVATAGRVATLLVLGAHLFILPLSQTWAQYVTKETTITRSLRGRDVLRLQTELNVPPQAATGVAKVSINAPRPSPADRDLLVVFYLKAYYSGPNESFAYRVPVRLEEGKSQVELQIPHAQYSSQAFWDVGVFEDGRDIEDKRVSPRGTNLNWISHDAFAPGIAAIAARSESASALASQLQALLETRLDASSIQVNSQPEFAKLVVSVSDASSDWRSFFSYDAWVLSAAAVAEINRQPLRVDALRTYVSAGGTLLVHSVSDEAALAHINSFFAGQAAANHARMWTKFRDYQSLSATGSSEPPRLLTSTDECLESLDGRTLLTHTFGFGRVFISAEPLAEISTVWLPERNNNKVATTPSVGSETDGDWFWRNLIRAVGKPPVWIFCGMVTLFGALLGPGLLIFTARLARRSLMIFLVPAISIIATLAIVSYGVLNEGFETHLRVTSVQAIDATSQQGFVWSRQNYFSGLPPREGLNFSPQTYARTVYAEDERNRYGMTTDPRSNVKCTVTYLPDHQNWTGWLRPRQQQQLLIGHAAKFTQLPIAIGPIEPNRIAVKNLTPASLPLVLVRGAGSAYFLAQNIPSGETVELTAEDKDTLGAKVSQLMVDYRPSSPPELGEGGSLLEFGSNSRRYTSSNSFGQEDVLNKYFGMYLSAPLEVPPFGFAVLATQSTAVEVPLSGINADNLHLIIGAQSW